MKIRIISPSDREKNNPTEWGDYWVKVDLQEEFKRRGYDVVEEGADVDFFLFGTPWWGKSCTAKQRLCWIYSHPDVARKPKSDEFLKQFDHIFVLSSHFLEFMKTKYKNSSVLLGGTSKKFKDREAPPIYDVVFMGNTGKPRRVEALKKLVSLNKYRIGIVDPKWGKYIEPNDKVDILPCVSNRAYTNFFNKARVTFYIGHEDMRLEGFVAVRILDIFASSECLCLSEQNAGLDEYFSYVPQFETIDDLVEHVDWYTEEKHWVEAWHDGQVCRDEIANKNHTFMKVVDEIETVIKKGA